MKNNNKISSRISQNKNIKRPSESEIQVSIKNVCWPWLNTFMRNKNTTAKQINGMATTRLLNDSNGCCIYDKDKKSKLNKKTVTTKLNRHTQVNETKGSHNCWGQDAKMSVNMAFDLNCKDIGYEVDVSVSTSWTKALWQCHQLIRCSTASTQTDQRQGHECPGRHDCWA